MKASSCCSPIIGSWYNSTHSRMRSSLAKHIVQRLSSKRVRQIEIRARGKLPLLPPPVGSTGGSVAQCSPIPGNEMMLYFSVQLVKKIGGLSPPSQSEKWEGLSPPYLRLCTYPADSNCTCREHVGKVQRIVISGQVKLFRIPRFTDSPIRLNATVLLHFIFVCNKVILNVFSNTQLL